MMSMFSSSKRADKVVLCLGKGILMHPAVFAYSAALGPQQQLDLQGNITIVMAATSCFVHMIPLTAKYVAAQSAL